MTRTDAPGHGLARPSELHEAMVERMPAGLVVLDRDMRFVEMNGAAARMNGLRREEAIGRYAPALLPDLPEGRIRAAVERVLATGEVVADVEVAGRTPASPSADGRWLTSYFPITRSTGERLVGVLVTDIAPRARDQERRETLQRATRAMDDETGEQARLERLLEVVAEHVRGACAVHVLADSGPVTSILRAGSHGHPRDDGFDDLEAAARVISAVGAGDTVMLDGTSDADRAAASALLGGIPCVRAIAAPLVARGQMLGVLVVSTSVADGDHEPVEQDFVRDVASRSAVALDNARLYERERHVARTLQESMLPPSLEAPDGYEVAAHLVAGGEGYLVGGDFYDLVHVEDAAVAVVGDVCGRGPEAAALMAMARYTIRAQLGLADSAPRAVLTRLHHEIRSQRPGSSQFLTAVCARIRASGSPGEVEVAAPGHPPPLVLRRTGDLEPVEAPGTLLGVLERIVVTETAVRLMPGESLLLFTDGVLETPDPTGSPFGLEGIQRVLAPLLGASAAHVADAVTGAVRRHCGGDPVDDVAVLVLRRRDD